MPSERPILFSDEMVRAILDGRKTQTRRVVRFLSGMEEPGRAFGGLNPPDQGHVCDRLELCDWVGGAWSWYSSDGGCTCKAAARSPYGAPGDHLWVREAHAIARLDYWHDYWADAPEGGDTEQPSCMEAEQVCYRATPRLGWRRWVGPTAPAPDAFQGRPHALTYLAESSPLESGPAARVARWRPSIHMPRWASRLTLRVTEVRVERLQNIDEDGALAEGIDETILGLHTADGHPPQPHPVRLRVTAREAFADLWDDINGERALWASNPFVWVVAFERVEVARG